jgi:predicted short-subunit dehydrogenase-like oxidoreductase (DUF2520 family)
MNSVVIIGSGNVAQHLIKAVEKAPDLDLVQVFSRSHTGLKHLIPQEKITSNYEELKDATIYLICVSDNAIPSVSNALPFQGKLVAHTSGSVALQEMNTQNRRAVLYPLQTFSKQKELDFTKVPLCLESEYETDYEILEKIASALSHTVYKIDSTQRQALHVAAVFVCNFVNHLYKIGNDICDEYDIPFAILRPLIMETASKITVLSPNEAQTGPAKRNDTTTINKHLNGLTKPNQKELYKILTKSIIDDVEKL